MAKQEIKEKQDNLGKRLSDQLLEEELNKLFVYKETES